MYEIRTIVSCRFDSEETFEGYVFKAASSLLEDIKFMIRQLSE